MHVSRLAIIYLVILFAVLAVPAVAGTYTVTNTNGDGPGSLRVAMYQAAGAAGSMVTFNIPTTDPGYNASSGYWRIYVQSALPTISASNTTIDGTSQTTNQGDTNPNGPEIMLTPQPGTGFSGLVITNSNCIIRGLAICGFVGGGIDISGSVTGQNKVAGCYIGIDPTGSGLMGNGNYGIRISQSRNNTIGGPPLSGSAPDRNVISGNSGYGIYVTNYSMQNNIYGNYIGTNAGGNCAVPNQTGICLDNNTSGTQIGGTGTGAAGNLISGNYINGILLNLNTTGMNTIKNNLIGTNAAGTAALPNQTGIALTSFTHYETIEANTISGNYYDGIALSQQASSVTIRNNYIGTNATAGAALPNGHNGIAMVDAQTYATVIGNIISGNTWNGISISGRFSTITANKIGAGPDGGPSSIPNGGSGIILNATANHNTIGGHTTADKNTISGNTGCGIEMHGATDNTIIGNYIGADSAGNIAVGNGSHGVMIEDNASGNYIGGTGSSDGNLISGNAGYGVEISKGADLSYIQGNKIGTRAGAVSALPNLSGGILIGSGPTPGMEAANNVIGGTTTGTKNLVSGNNGWGIEINGSLSVSGTQIKGNFVGTDAQGGSAIPNTAGGIRIAGSASNTTIGGSTSLQRNIISGNGGPGVLLSGPGVTNNSVAGNFIGTSSGASFGLPNYQNGIVIEAGANHNNIGGTPGYGNSICGHSGSGVLIDGAGTNYNGILGNSIGAPIFAPALLDVHNDVGITIRNGASYNIIGGPYGNDIVFNHRGVYLLGDGSVRNKISANRIYNCATAGITLDGVKTMYGVSCTYENAAHVPNYGQVYPSITRVADRDGGIDINGFLNSAPDKTYVVEFFLSLNKNASGFGDGQRFLGSITVDTGPTGIGYFHKWLQLDSVPWPYVTATATDPDGNTSEFSNAVARNDSLALLTMRSNDLAKGATSPPTGVYAYVKDSVQPISALGLPGYAFSRWDGVVEDPLSASTSVTMDADKTVTAQFSSSVAASKRLPDGRTATASHCTVTARKSSYHFWIEAPDRSSGILVYKAQHGLSAGAVVDVTGTMATDTDSNRYINASTITTYPETGSVKPLVMANRSAGGGPWFYDSGTRAGQAGVLLEPGKPSTEANNIGLLIQTTGKVTASDASSMCFYVDDGSGLVSVPVPGAPKGIRVFGIVPNPDPLPPGWNPVGHHVIVTGVAYSAGQTSDALFPRIYATQVTLVD